MVRTHRAPCMRCMARARTGGPPQLGKRTRPHSVPTALRGHHAAARTADLLLLLNVPPTWAPPGAAGHPEQQHGEHGASGAFAAVRPGVLWPCPSVEASVTATGGGPSGLSHGNGADASASRSSSGGGSGSGGSAASSGRAPRWRSAAGGGSGSTSSCNGNEGQASDSGGAAGGERSWRVDEADLWGRSLPRQGYMGSSSSGGTSAARGTQPLTAGAFVAQDSTAAAAARQRGGAGGSVAAPCGEVEGLTFVISRGALLSDDCACGDVDAVMRGAAAVAALQTWPAGHPFALRDELLVHALEEGRGGLPLWLVGK